MALLAVVTAPLGAHADPGHPGVPHDPTVLYVEDFENVPSGSEPLPLPSYVGANGQTYTAAPYWLSLADCNGFITNSAAATTPPGCAAFGASTGIPAMANALGAIGGNVPASANHAVVAHTNDDSNNPGPGLVEFRSVNPVPLSAPNRFITFSVDVVSRNCTANPAILAFYVLDGTTEIPAFKSPINVCTDPRAVDITTGIRGGRYFANGAVLANDAILASMSCGVVMRNRQGRAQGNDHAFDNITCLDATPQLDKSFSPTEVPVGQTSTLTFIVTNTSELAAKPGWSFTDTLAPGLVLANPADASTDCANGVVTAAAGGTSIAVTGDLELGDLTCQVAVSVTSNTAGTYLNAPGNVDTVGLEAPGPTSVRFTAKDTPPTVPDTPTPTVPSTPVVPSQPRFLALTGSSPAPTAVVAGLALAIGAGLLGMSEFRLGRSRRRQEAG